ncbi:MAG: PhoU domain-containing protein [Nitrososphaerota archaeon]|nr:PhoU domain-containing protein [Nitrososphaerota archaeon]
METRRLQKLKGGSYIISLPKEWVEKFKLRSGEEIVVSQETDGSLKLLPATEDLHKPSEAILNLEDNSDLRSIKYCAVTYYIQGSDRIRIVSKKIIPAEQKRQVKQLRAELPGVEVSEEEANQLTFQVLIDPMGFSVESLIERTFEFSLKLHEDVVKALVNLDFPLAMEVLERSNEAQRHYRFTIRLVAIAAFNPKVSKKIGVRNCQDCINFTLTIRDISRLIYYFSSIANYVLSLKGKEVDREVLSSIEKISRVAYEMQKNAMGAFLKKDIKLAIRVFDMMNDVRDLERASLKKIMEKVANVDSAITLSMIARDMRRIAGQAVAIADDALNRVLRPSLRLNSGKESMTESGLC